MIQEDHIAGGKLSDKESNLVTLSPLSADEDKAREFLEAKRWPNGPICPHCESQKVYRLEPKPESKRPVRPGVYKCGKCRKQFTVRIGTVFEGSKIPLCKWLMAIHLMTSSKKGISTHQIAREVGITQKSAWFLCHRIREAMRQEPMTALLKGTREADETSVGPREPRIRGTRKPGRRTSKRPAMVLVERKGNARPGSDRAGPRSTQIRRDLFSLCSSAAIMVSSIGSAGSSRSVTVLSLGFDGIGDK